MLLVLLADGKRANSTVFDFKAGYMNVMVCEDKITADTEEKIIALIDSITEELILPRREKVVI